MPGPRPSLAAACGLCLGAALLVSTPGCRPQPTATPSPAGPPDRAPGDAAADVAALGERLLQRYFELEPTAATSYGHHAFDGQWPDLSSAGLERQRGVLDELAAAAAAIDPARLDADGRLELALVHNHLELWRFGLDVEQGHRRNPYGYASTIGSGLDDLISRDFAPIERRAQHVAERLERLPAYVDQALANLQPVADVYEPHARVAVSQLAGVRTLIAEEIPARTKDAPQDVQQRVAAATPAALEAVTRMQSTLRDVVLPAARGRWRLGKDRFDEKLRLTLHTDMSADSVLARAREEHARVRARMAALARELYPPLLGEGALERFLAAARGDEEALDNQIIRQVLDALAADHPTAAGLRDACAENLARLDAFVAERRLVPLDTKEVLEVIWTPPHARGYAIAGLASPGPLDARQPGLPSFYLVQPIPEDWSAPRRESFLREYNSFMLEILSIHEAIPGHFVQLYHGKREPSRLRRVLGNGAFIEGWAVYSERLMVEAGYAGAGPAKGARRPAGVSEGLWRVKTDPALRAKAIELHGQKFYLRTVTNAILDHEIHAGEMDEEAAVRLMVQRSFQEEGEARAKWIRAQLVSTQLSTYFVGASAWFSLRARAEARAAGAGAPLDLHEFHGQALAHGAPPVHWLPELMGWPADAPSGA